MGIFDSIGGMFGLGDSDQPQQGQQGQTGQTGQMGQNGQPSMNKLMLAQALMGGAGGGAPANSFMGGLAQGLSPMLRMQMMQHMLGNSPMMQQQPQPQQPLQQPQVVTGGSSQEMPG